MSKEDNLAEWSSSKELHVYIDKSQAEKENWNVLHIMLNLKENVLSIYLEM